MPCSVNATTCQTKAMSLNKYSPYTSQRSSGVAHAHWPSWL